MTRIEPLSNDQINYVNAGALWLLVLPAVYAAVEVGRALHGATCDEHPDRK